MAKRFLSRIQQMISGIFRTRFWITLSVFFALVGPGIITSNVDNDAGGITTYSLAGADYGLTLLWILVPITFVLKA